jgi:hypothetical protein
MALLTVTLQIEMAITIEPLLGQNNMIASPHSLCQGQKCLLLDSANVPRIVSAESVRSS